MQVIEIRKSMPSRLHCTKRASKGKEQIFEFQAVKRFIGLQNRLNVFSVLMVFSHMTCAVTCGAKTAFGNGDTQTSIH